MDDYDDVDEWPLERKPFNAGKILGEVGAALDAERLGTDHDYFIQAGNGRLEHASDDDDEEIDEYLDLPRSETAKTLPPLPQESQGDGRTPRAGLTPFHWRLERLDAATPLPRAGLPEIGLPEYAELQDTQQPKKGKKKKKKKKKKGKDKGNLT